MIRRQEAKKMQRDLMSPQALGLYKESICLFLSLLFWHIYTYYIYVITCVPMAYPCLPLSPSASLYVLYRLSASLAVTRCPVPLSQLFLLLSTHPSVALELLTR